MDLGVNLIYLPPARPTQAILDAIGKMLKYLDEVTPAKMKATFAKWIDDTPYVLTILPNEKLGVNETGIDRTSRCPLSN